MTYICALLVALVVMNTYPLVVLQNLVFQSKQTTMQNSVRVMSSALSDLGNLKKENVTVAMKPMREARYDRILVADRMGVVLYDSGKIKNSAIDKNSMSRAVDGYDVFSSFYRNGAFDSFAIVPIMYRNRVIGVVYAFEHDAQQGNILQREQAALLRVSLALVVASVLIATLFSHILTRRFRILLRAIGKMRDGSYNEHVAIGGHDEVTELSREFNDLSDRLQETEEVRRRFVADASHELKTPLAGIRLMSDSILQTEQMDMATVREFVGDIDREAQRLTRITEDLLSLTKMDSHQPVQAELIAVGDVCRRVEHSLQLSAEEKKITLDVEIVREKTVLATADDLYRILFNLVENAIKYNREGGFVRVILDGADGSCLLTVEDNGIGIPKEDLPHIFDRFYRVDKMRSRAAGGTGLGLSIVADTVKRCGGSVRTENREGGGTRFIVSFTAI